MGTVSGRGRGGRHSTRSAGSSSTCGGIGRHHSSSSGAPGRPVDPGPDRRHGGRRAPHQRRAQRPHRPALADPARWRTCRSTVLVVQPAHTEPLEFASLTHSGGTVAELVDRMFDPSASVAELARLREQWPGRIVVKGIQDPEDARIVAEPASTASSCRTTGSAARPGGHPARGLAADRRGGRGTDRGPARHRDHGRRRHRRGRGQRGQGRLVGRAYSTGSWLVESPASTER